MMQLINGQAINTGQHELVHGNGSMLSRLNKNPETAQGASTPVEPVPSDGMRAELSSLEAAPTTEANHSSATPSHSSDASKVAAGKSFENSLAEGLFAEFPKAKLGKDDEDADLTVGTSTIDVKTSRSGPHSIIVRTPVPKYSNDSTSSQFRADSLDMRPDAVAFAQLALSKDTLPPLAVGVFGSWGSGKSYFMDLIQAEVKNIADRSLKRPTSIPSPEVTDFHTGVVQIRFNAWHYAETNLWASLVGHIFQELARALPNDTTQDVIGKLSTARLLTLDAAQTLMQTRREHLAARASLTDANVALASASAKPLRTKRLFSDLVISAFQDESNEELQTAKADLQSAADALGLGATLTSTQELTQAGEDLLRKGIQGRDIWRSIAKNIGSPWAAAGFVLLAGALPLIAAECVRFAADTLALHSAWISERGAAGIAAIGVLAAWFKKASTPMLLALQKLGQAKALVDTHVAANLEVYKKQVAANEAAVAKARADVDAAGEQLKATSARLAEVREELHSQSPAKRFIKFVHARATDGEYAKHLGIVSTVRKDFEELSKLVGSRSQEASQALTKEVSIARSQVQLLIDESKGQTLLTDEEIASLQELVRADDDKPPPFQRIILYIDDVDRCPPHKVIEVLQAVHMLLAFELFVVFVAVDVRWVEGSLAHQYSGMLKEANSTGSLTSASDYLEKIFQVPYWVPSVNPVSTAKLLAPLIAPDEYPSMKGDSFSTADSLSAKIHEQATRLGAIDIHHFVGVRLSSTEREAVLKYASILNSPRKVVRFANVARLLKARGAFETADGTAKPPDYLLAQLAIATASPEQYGMWLLVLRTANEPDLYQLRLRLGDGYLSRNPAIKDTLLNLRDRGYEAAEPKQLLHLGAWADRLSFAVPISDPNGRLVEMINRHVEARSGDIPPPAELFKMYEQGLFNPRQQSLS